MTFFNQAQAPREVELKLEVEPRSLGRIREHPLLRAAADKARPAQILHSVYFDTDDQALRASGVSLRIRDDGERRIQTIKVSRNRTDVFLDRDEWEREVEGHEPDLSQEDGAALKALLDEDVVERLRPVFDVRVQRNELQVEWGASMIDVALDRGRIEAAESQVSFAEVELELKRGATADLFRLALELSDAAPLRLSFKAKSQRGYEAVGSELPKRVKAEPVELGRGLPAGAAFQIIGRSCLRHLVSNAAVLRAARDPDAVHQLRVALRRLRAAVTLFKDVVADGERDRIRSELKWMADQLGDARDLHVFITTTLEPQREAKQGDPHFARLLEEYDTRRDRAYRKAQSAVSSRRFQRGVLAVAAWTEAGAWIANADEISVSARNQPIELHAKHELAQRWKKIRKKARQLSELDAEARHRVRIEIKKLRYATEFFEGLFAGPKTNKRRRTALACLERLQELLGTLNDIAVGRNMTHSAEAGASADVMVQEEHILAEAEFEYRKFRDMKPFWQGK